MKTARRMKHVRATTVPGLAAKAIMDIMVSVENADAESAYVPHLEHAG